MAAPAAAPQASPPAPAPARPPPRRKKRDWIWWIFALGSAVGCVVLLTLLLLPDSARGAVTDAIQPLRGGEDAGIMIAYVGFLGITYAQAYTLVKRSGDPALSKKFGGAAFWLSLHVFMSVVGVAFVLIHAGFPYTFRFGDLTAHGYAGLATVLLILTTVSGFFGRYLYRHMPLKKQFRYWQQVHIIITVLMFVFASYHAMTSGE